ncbi:HAD family hydrolase [Kitasatospora griseola]|uniref:HAD family hydrolase n=1 Tax=Kitasatospora griseola TaxID=2064 RepID=UPI003828D3E2
MDAFTAAYWAARQPYDSGRCSSTEYWTAVLRRLSRPADARTVEDLRRADIDSCSHLDAHMAAYARSLRSRAEVAVLSDIPADHADALLAAQPWLHAFDHLALSGKAAIAVPDRAAFHHCTAALRAAPVDFLFVDDREENVRAARALGMNGHHQRTPLHRPRTPRSRHRQLAAGQRGLTPRRRESGCADGALHRPSESVRSRGRQ